MLVFKKIVAGTFMVLSVVAVIVLIISLFGSWVVKARLETVTIDLLLVGEEVMERSQEGLERVDELLHTSSRFVDEVDSRVQRIGTEVVDRTPSVVELLDYIGLNLVPKIEQAVDTFNAIEANVVAINDAADAITDIPILNNYVDFPETNKLQDLEDRMLQIRTDVQRLHEETQARRADLIDGKISGVRSVTVGLGDSIRSTKTSVAELDANLEESAQNMADLRERIPGLYTTITIILNLLILLTILAFISLFLHAWEYFKCTEQGLSGLMPGECEETPANA